MVDAALSPTTSTTAFVSKKMCTIPAQFAPITDISGVHQGSGANRWNLTVNTLGEFFIDRYGASAEVIGAPEGCWLPFSVIYIGKLSLQMIIS